MPAFWPTMRFGRPRTFLAGVAFLGLDVATATDLPPLPIYIQRDATLVLAAPVRSGNRSAKKGLSMRPLGSTVRIRSAKSIQRGPYAACTCLWFTNGL